ncbi:hypothetical protein LPJ61_000956 [Coemansia biformis]|uniref:Sld7 C-terminal domain-containing protein n=1 Tax=Coemansia biformis TaxID=1286918 RepID=A0A9W7YFS2_9FUNG|nr:hypothetical protein LPJ61_000956 [Coemansia biformis]
MAECLASDPASAAAHADPRPCRLAWVAKVDAPGAAIDATAALLPLDGSPCSAAVAQPLWPGGRLRLLTLVQLDSVPPALFAPMAFALRINAGDDCSRKYVNGLVGRLLQSRAAALARIEGAEPPADARNPFVVPPTTARSQMRLPEQPIAVIYAEHHPAARLVLHLLDSRPEWLGSLAAAAAAVDAQPEGQSSLRVDSGLACEHAFVAHLAQQSQAERQAQMERTLSAENMVVGGGGGAAPAQRKTSGTARGKKKMTLSDIEDFAGGAASTKVPEVTPEMPSTETEQTNKKLAKQLVIASLKERGIARDHRDFAALWGQIYRSLKFALRAKLPCHVYTVRELRAEVEKHARFYCSS